jgi:HK97 family phage portal protein|tara:strand:+ start:730 stop:3084 length:2355 start_codon:yes stop_codon:yes gene_type:complete
MSIIDDIKKLFIKNIKTKQAPITVYNNVGYSTPKRDSFIQYAEEGYQENAIVYKCVNEISNGASSVELKVFDDDIELEAHPLINLLERPNPLQAGNEFFQSLYAYLLLSGNSYVLRTGTENQPPKELHLLRPDRIKIEPSNTTIPKSYQYELSGQVIASYPVDSETGASEIKHFKLWNPTDDYYGLSPIRAASVDIDQHNYASKHNINLLMNGARPSGAIVFRPRDEAGMNVQLTESQRQQLISDLELRFQGTNNSGRAMLLEGDFDWKEMGLSPKDMDFLQLKNMSARDIAMCFGVPSQLVGIPDAQTYSNVQEARLALYEETIIPLIRRVESDLNEYLAPYFGERLRIQYDIDSIPAMAERRKRIYENVTVAVREGIISRNEARDRLGLEPITGGDEVYISANLFPLGEPETSNLDEAEPNPSKEGYDAYGIKSEIRKDVFTTEEEAEERAKEIGCSGIHSHEGDDGTVYMPCASHSDYERITGEELKYHTADPEYLVQQDPRMGEGEDLYETVAEASERAEELGCDGTHTLRTPDGNIYMPCASHSQYLRVTGQDKALEDIDTTPTQGMVEEARKGLEWRKEFKRGGTAVGVARANQLVRKEKLSPRTVLRMYSFFARHEVDKQAEGFNAGEKGYPSAGRIAWALWGGDAGQTWSAKKRDQIKLEIEKACCQDCEEKAPVSGKIKKTLEGKIKEHNDKHGSKKGKRVTLGMLSNVFRRGVGAYRTNPESVRRNVTGPDQWGIARVNAFLYAVRTGRFRSGQFDRDLLPKDHPLYKPKGKDD